MDLGDEESKPREMSTAPFRGRHPVFSSYAASPISLLFTLRLDLTS